MALTRLQLKNTIAISLERPDDTAFLTFLDGRIDQMLFFLFDMHDWNWKHKDGAFNTVATTEAYDLSSTSTDIRSSQDLEVLWDSTNKRFINKVELRTVRKQYPEGSQAGKPTRYAPWGSKEIYLDNIPDDTYAMKYLYLAKATLPTADGDDLETVCGVPDYCHYLLEKLVLAEAMIIDNDSRRDNLLIEINKIWKVKAVNADMKHLESTARFKFWAEEIQPQGTTYDDYLRHVWWDE